MPTARKSKSTKPRSDVYETVTNTIATMFEEGIANPDAWRKPWKAIGQGHRSAVGRSYRGINTFLLAVSAARNNYTVPVWATYNQWQSLGLQVAKRPDDVEPGDWGTTVVLWKPFKNTKKDADGNDVENRGLFARAFNVFNVAQLVEGSDLSNVPALRENEARHIDARDETCDHWIWQTGADISYGGDMAYYTPAADRIQLPTFESFDSATAFYGTAAHELTHWTGHKSRCDRDFSGRFGTEAYAAEELVAELGSAFAMARLGLEASPREDHAHYLANWAKLLRSDKRAIFTASSKAQRACDFLFGDTGDESSDDDVAAPDATTDEKVTVNA
jgi:antirestriction protein ArdC